MRKPRQYIHVYHAPVYWNLGREFHTFYVCLDIRNTLCLEPPPAKMPARSRRVVVPVNNKLLRGR